MVVGIEFIVLFVLLTARWATWVDGPFLGYQDILKDLLHQKIRQGGIVSNDKKRPHSPNVEGVTGKFLASR